MKHDWYKYVASLDVNDPLKVYLREAECYPLLTPEEQKALALRYRETGDREAAHKLITGNLRLVVKIVRGIQEEFLWKNREFPKQILIDLIQEGNLGLMLAVENFDPYREVMLSSYASFRIKRFVRNFIRDERGGSLSMDAPLQAKDAPPQDDFRKNLHDVLPDPGPQADEVLADVEHMQAFSQKLEEFRQTLNVKELDIMESRILVDQPGTLKKIADRHGVTYGRVRQIEDKLIPKLRNFLQSDNQKISKSL